MATTIKITKSTPKWMAKIALQQQKAAERYKKACTMFAETWNIFLAEIEDINDKFDTQFSAEQAISDFGNMEADEDDDDED